MKSHLGKYNHKSFQNTDKWCECVTSSDSPSTAKMMRADTWDPRQSPLIPSLPYMGSNIKHFNQTYNHK